ncbi:3-methyladenine DNA glycosylase [Microbacterium mangrovi]|uniref:3-methyladenine DNA glycosylase n=1 Tax=Microbacterium mangrovi TaxID=1348253 RepID=A0A0B2A260_9MICO|nr:3-methyladenine DNA glycosylase [Microbacterium mangrovi]KHK95648.1 3-methyladenine DNA glycosylase [Microbacterium mangrovi]
MIPDAASARRGTTRGLAALEAEYRPRHPLDLRLTLGIQRHGVGDPTFQIAHDVVWRASRTPAGVATLALRQSADGVVRAAAWGAGAECALDRVPRLCGADDDDAGFDGSAHPVVASSLHRHPGLRLSANDEVFDSLVAAIFEQKVTGLQAFGAWRRILTRHGERAPGPTPRPMFAPPTVAGWRAIPSWSWHRAGLEPPQSRTIVTAADRAASILRSATDPVAADRVLTALSGIGAWTSAETRIRAFGDPDAVSVGDYHLAHEVGFALTGQRTDDDGMLRLLAPWAGQRQRAVRLIRLSGVREARRGPRLAPENHHER